MSRSTHEARFRLTAQDKTRAALTSVKTRLKGIGGAVTGLQGKLFALAGVGGFGLLLKGIVSTNVAFQTMKSSLKTITGSTEAANDAFDRMEAFAKQTPFDLDTMVQSFIKLKALGLDPSEEALRAYGNTASAMGKSLDQMIEAVADAATGEMERLKEFGIKAKKQGDEITFTFQGVATTVGNNAAEITGYLKDIGNNQFGSAMADQMKNLLPAFSNLGAAIRGVQTDIGEAGVNALITELATSTTAWIESLDEEQIKKFTHAALNGMADVAEGADKLVSYIQANPIIAEVGILGFLLLGKRGKIALLAGIAAYEGGKKITENIGSLLTGVSDVNIEDRLGQAQADLKATQQFGGDSTPFMRELVAEQQALVDSIRQTIEGMSILPSNIGDQTSINEPFNASTFEEWANQIKTQGARLDPQKEETNTLLGEIVEAIRAQTNVAVVGP